MSGADRASSRPPRPQDPTPVRLPPPRRTWLSTWVRRQREAVAWRWVFGLAGAAAVLWAALFGVRARQGPERCGPGLVPRGARCCAPGQELRGQRCVGEPTSCPPGLQLATSPMLGCVLQHEPARIRGGRLTLAPNDWESEGVIQRRTFDVDDFKLDRAEITVSQWRECQAAGKCEPLDAPGAAPREPGVPVTDVSAEQAAAYCAFRGGRLPTFDELLFAAAGEDGRRFPWGPHGLVCRRAAFGLEDGPCGEGATGPELAGSRPDGASADGVYDLVGNVAEWTKDPDGTLRLFGGSYRSKVASQLKSWSSEPARVGSDVGFRCAYDLRPGQ